MSSAFLTHDVYIIIFLWIMNVITASQNQPKTSTSMLTDVDSTVKYRPISTTIFLSDVFQSPHYNYCYEKIKMILYTRRRIALTIRYDMTV